MLDILIAAFERDARPEPSAVTVLAAYRDMREEIAHEKAAWAPERYLEALAALRAENPRAYAELLPRLRQWLSKQADGDAAPKEPRRRDDRRQVFGERAWAARKRRYPRSAVATIRR